MITSLPRKFPWIDRDKMEPPPAFDLVGVAMSSGTPLPTPKMTYMDGHFTYWAPLMASLRITIASFLSSET